MRKILLLVCIVTFSSTTYGQSAKQVPTLDLRDINGRPLRLTDYKGKVVLLNFWATWCPPCRAEMPDLIRWQRKYRNSGLQIIGVTYPPNDIRKIRKFIQGLKINYPIAIGTKETKSLFLESETLPITVVIDQTQMLRETIEGILLPEEFEQKIKPLLKQSRSLNQHQSKLKKAQR